MKLACVIHRFGADIAGGSEAHCRAIATRLAGAHDVTVLTTTARDHVTWAPAYAAGRSVDGLLQVRRFPVARQRSMHRFLDVSERAFGGRPSLETEEEWFRENGPDAPALLEHLDAHGREYDRVLFWSFRYATTWFGVPRVADRVWLVPTAEDDPVIRFASLRTFFAQPACLLLLTPEEGDLVARVSPDRLPPSVVIGTGIDPAMASHIPRDRLGVSAPYLLYVGRVDPNKGCGTLVRFFLASQAGTATPVTLVLAGPVNMPMPAHPQITVLGQVDAPRRDALIAHAAAVVMPSPYESLSLALLEAWNLARPAIVNGRCAVLRGQARRSGGAIPYDNATEFASALRYLLTHDAEAAAMGRQGLAYVEREYRWPGVMDRLERALGLRPQASDAGRQAPGKP
jgi:glycosyltransferase involved in cell wall biosynthesis